MPTRAPTHRPFSSKPRPAFQRSESYVPLPLHWRKLRVLVLAQEPLCRECSAAGRTTASTDVDHIKPRTLGGTHDRSNLQALCAECHRTKTAREAVTIREARR